MSDERERKLNPVDLQVGRMFAFMFGALGVFVSSFGAQGKGEIAGLLSCAMGYAGWIIFKNLARLFR